MNGNQIKHLEFIQATITRMNQNSFQMKGWAIAILSALLAIFAASVGDSGSGNVAYLFVAVIPTTVFWMLDAYYLQQERKFRGIYNEAAHLTEETKRIEVRDFEMPLNKFKGGKYSFIKVVFSRTEWPIYLTLDAGLIVAGLVLGPCR